MYSKETHEYNSQENRRLEIAIQKMASGDKTALAELYERTHTAIYAFIVSILKDKHKADDVFQEVYLKVYENATSYKAKGKPMAWLITIAKNQCLMEFRKVKALESLEDVEELWTTNPDVEERLILEAAFKQISDEERNIIVLHVLSGLKHREIAKILDLPLATVLSKYHRSLKKLKGMLEENVNE
jgi:RNA polymerase sigma-70 factor (ECF subfamily)